MKAYLFLSLAWILFYALHSLLASTKVKAIFGLRQQMYRLFYNLVALATLGMLGYFHFHTSSVTLFTASIWTKIIGVFLMLYGLFVHFRTFQVLSVRKFVGVVAEGNEKLVATGIYQQIRHPIYLGVILLFTGFLVFFPIIPNFISLLVTLVYLPFGIYWEEQKLMQEFGNTYQTYSERVPAVLPRQFIR